ADGTNLIPKLAQSEVVQNALNAAEDLTEDEVRDKFGGLIYFAQNSGKYSGTEMQLINNILGRFRNIRQTLANQFNIDIRYFRPNPRKVLNYQEIHDSTTGVEVNMVDFNPLKHPLSTGTYLVDGCDMVDECIKQKNGLFGTNGGFFNSVGMSRHVTKAVGFWTGSRTKFTDYIPIASAILKSNGMILMDSGDYSPAVGWSRDGSKFLFDYVKTRWMVKSTTYNVSDMVLTKYGAGINPTVNDYYLYLPDPNNPVKSDGNL
ncbi:unnamed protein product, partial [marine sediment metagenome]